MQLVISLQQLSLPEFFWSKYLTHSPRRDLARQIWRQRLQKPVCYDYKAL